ncbi:MAG: ImuA family protein [Beijerinckiaceae bacterium]
MSLSVADLRHVIARIETGNSDTHGRAPLGVAGIDEALGGGLRRGALHEVHGAEAMDAGAATGFALGLASRLAAVDGGPLVWIAERMATREWGELYGPGMAELGFGFPRVLMVSAHKLEALLVAARQTAGARLGGVAVLAPYGGAKGFDMTASRKLALAAEAADMAIVSLRIGDEPAPGVAMTRWRVAGAPATGEGDRHLMGRPRFRIELIRNRGGRTGAWSVEWNCDASIFRLSDEPRTAERDRALPGDGTLPCPVAAPAFDRPDLAGRWRAAG